MTVGEELRAARKHARVSIAQLSERTCIRTSVLERMEADDFTPCGGHAYARGQVRSIATALKVDPEPLLAALDREQGAPALGITAGLEADHAMGAVDIREPKKISWSGAGVVGAGILTAIAVAAYAVGGNGAGTHSPGLAQSTQPITPPPSTAAAVAPAPVAPPAAAAHGVDVVIKAVNGSSWVGVLPGYKVQFTLEPGQSRTFHDASAVSLRIGNPTAVQVYVNGHLVQTVGSQAVSKTFSTHGVAEAQS
ncbi:MAG TPA: helix-turn-helix domain-containing protein [Mycobacteriales bacterium]|nr:helix-turn-helix domain-containing protein [Mycobacteriales bacterium]